MKEYFNIEKFLDKYPNLEKNIQDDNIDIYKLEQIYMDYIKYKSSYETQADFIANILRYNSEVHSVKSSRFYS